MAAGDNKQRIATVTAQDRGVRNDEVLKWHHRLPVNIQNAGVWSVTFLVDTGEILYATIYRLRNGQRYTNRSGEVAKRRLERKDVRNWPPFPVGLSLRARIGNGEYTDDD